jgi:crotonobetainyl-CoA:carnitine CoA-transferase CaiB-like acyl-CoA transferase
VRPVNDLDEALRHPQVQATGMLAAVPHTRGGEVLLVGTPLRMSGTPEAVRPRHASAPLLGEHTRDVLGGLLGYDERRLQRLADAHIVGMPEP